MRVQEIPHLLEDGVLAAWGCVVRHEPQDLDLPICPPQCVEIHPIPAAKIPRLVVLIVGGQLCVEKAVQHVCLLLSLQLIAKGHETAAIDVCLLHTAHGLVFVVEAGGVGEWRGAVIQANTTALLARAHGILVAALCPSAVNIQDMVAK